MNEPMHPPGTVVIVTGTLTRYGAFSRSLIQASYPLGTQFSWSEGINLAANLNRGIGQSDGEWVWLIGDDHLFAPDTLMRMLAHNLDLVAPVCSLRLPPYWPIVYRSESEDGSFEVYPADTLPTRGVHPVAACSMAGMVIRTKVFKAMMPPYFEVGQIRSDELGEDLWFFHKLGLAGISPYLDCDTAIGHITPAAIWPTKRAESGWGVRIDPTCQIPATAEVLCP